MAKSDQTRQALSRLGSLVLAPGPETLSELARALGNKSSLVVARAAGLAARGGLGQLIPDLVKTFNRLQKRGAKADPGCSAKNALVRALCELEAREEELFLGARGYVQREAVYGGSVDTAGELRGLCGVGLVRCDHPDVLDILTDLLVDLEPEARALAARAIGDSGQAAGVLLLRLKLHVGDSSPDVLAECMASLLSLAPGRAIPFLAERFLDRDPAGPGQSVPWELAVLALGECRHEVAFARLRKLYDRDLTREARRLLLLSMATSRLSEALDFLVELVRHGEEATAPLAVEALEIFRDDPAVWDRVEAARATC